MTVRPTRRADEQTVRRNSRGEAVARIRVNRPSGHGRWRVDVTSSDLYNAVIYIYIRKSVCTYRVGNSFHGYQLIFRPSSSSRTYSHFRESVVRFQQRKTTVGRKAGLIESLYYNIILIPDACE